MKKIWLFIICVFLLQFPAFSQTPEAAFPYSTVLGVTIESQTPRLNEIITLYEKGLERERLKTYASAREAYRQVVLISDHLLSASYVGQQTVDTILPFAVAAAFRAALVTQNLINDKMLQLSDQLKLFEENDTWQNEILTAISNLKVVKKLNLPEFHFGLLYYARAYNRLGWGYALLNGSLWRRYVVYTPAAIATMVLNSREDLDKLAAIYAGEADLDLILRLSFGVDNLAAAKAAFKNLLHERLPKTLSGFQTEKVTSVLAGAKKLQTFEDILNNPQIKELLQTIQTLQNSLQIQSSRHYPCTAPGGVC